jgi:hypothetical protein
MWTIDDVYRVKQASVEAVQSLPFVRAFFPQTDPLTDRQDDATAASYEFAKLLAKEIALDNLLEAAARHRSEHPELVSVVRELKPKQVALKDQVDKAIGRQFRQTSKQVHPDRFGDVFLTQFSALTLAYQYLRDAKTRRQYMHDMAGWLVVGFVMEPTLLLQAHERWVTEQAKADQANTEHTRYQAAVQSPRYQPPKQHVGLQPKKQEQRKQAKPKAKCQPLAIEGGLAGKKPRQVGIRKIDSMGRKVQLEWRALSPVGTFRAYCHGVTIVMEGVATTTMHIPRVELQDLFVDLVDFYCKTICFPDWGTFAVSWYAHLVIDGIAYDTKRSDPVNVQLVHPNYEQAVKERPALLEMARRHTGRLKSEMTYYRAHEESLRDRAELQNRRKVLHRALGRAQLIIRNLDQTYRHLEEDADACPELSTLQQAAYDAAVVQSRFVDALASLDTKDSVKAFSRSLETMIETGQAGSWLKNVSTDEWINQGAEVNRLFQLLTEGKQANSLFLDPTTLHTAALRTDLFSEKQSQVLLQRSNEVEAHRQAEVEQILKNQDENAATEKKVKELERRSRLVGMSRGTLVRVVGLDISSDLNGSVGEYMGLDPNGQYAVQLRDTGGREVTLKRENFVREPEVCKTSAVEATSTAKSNTRQPVLVNSESRCVSGQIASNLSWSNGSTKRVLVQPTQPKLYSAKQRPQSQPCPSLILVRKEDISQFIGKRGAHMNELATKSGTTIDVDDNDVDRNGNYIVTVKGTKKAVEKARHMIADFNRQKGGPKVVTTTAVAPKPAALQIADRKVVTVSPAVATKSVLIAQTPTGPTKPAPVTRGAIEKRLGAPQKPITVNTAYSVSPSEFPPLGESSHISPTDTYQFAPLVGSSKHDPTASKVASKSTSPTTVVSDNPMFQNLVPLLPQCRVTLPVMLPLRYLVPLMPVNYSESLLQFLRTQESCLKRSPEDFHTWLVSQDVDSLATLEEAADDDDFMKEMQNNGIKGFKRTVFKKSLSVALGEATTTHETKDGHLASAYDVGLDKYLASIGVSHDFFHKIDNLAPRQLQCSISTVLMVVDPVLAADGLTYERHEIEAWGATKLINGKPVTSPQTGEVLKDISLSSNLSIRNLAREYLITEFAKLNSKAR